MRDESDSQNIREAREGQGYTGPDAVWRSLVDHELLHSLVAEVVFDRPSVVLRGEAGDPSFIPAWEKYEEEMLVLGMQIYLNSGECETIRRLPWEDAIRVANAYKEVKKGNICG